MPERITDKKAQSIARYCIQAGWAAPSLTTDKVRFLAAGEYNENWLLPQNAMAPSLFQHKELPIIDEQVQAGTTGDIVFRINHGSQLALDTQQIAYEFKVLKLLQASGVTPQPFTVAQPQQGNTTENAPDGSLEGGILTMAHLAGEPLDYKQDTETAAQIFAATHACPVPSDHGLIVQAEPVGDIVKECDGLLSRFSDHPRKNIHKKLCTYRDKVAALGKETLPLFTSEDMVIANTEVNSGNFCIARDNEIIQAGLVDWEKAVVTCRYQDLGHFLVPTTTLWKTSYTYSDEGRKGFITAYRDALQKRLEQTAMNSALPQVDELLYKTNVLEQTILLRGLSWCYMAWYEYTQQERALKNMDTFRVIERYLDEIEWFLQ